MSTLVVIFFLFDGYAIFLFLFCLLATGIMISYGKAKRFAKDNKTNLFHKVHYICSKYDEALHLLNSLIETKIAPAIGFQI